MGNPASRPVRHEEIQAGEFVWLATNVEFGDDGFKGLKHFIPIPQLGWHFHQDDAAHILQHIFDTTPSRLCWRQMSVVGVSKTSYLRAAFILPADFGSFISITLKTRRSSSSPNHYKMTLLHDGTSDPTTVDVDVLPTGSGDYYIFDSIPSGTYSPGDFCILQFEMLAFQNEQWAEVSEIEVAYRTARGNI